MPVAGQLRFGATAGSLVVVLLVAALTIGCALALASVRVACGPDEVRVGAGPWGWPVRRVAVADIVHARAERRDPLTLGTLGYREPPGHAAVMVRAGECLVLELTGERSLAVAVDGAEAAAAAVNARLAAGVH
ncbi:MAG TPA: hypothetical protein VIC57_01075 [Candidatus Dormibacteraeota bacterium]|jgi:hypothetical protein